LLKNWQKTGIEFKFHPIVEARIIIFDASTTYITSYNPMQKEESIGVRFQYPPIARLMQGLFNQKWLEASDINY